MLNLKRDLLLVRKEVNDGMTEDKGLMRLESGLFLPTEVVESNQVCEGTVIAAGPGKHHDKSGVFVVNTTKVGDRVLFAKTTGTAHKHEGEECLIMADSEILAVVSPD